LPVLGMTAIQARPIYYGTPQASMGKLTINQNQLQFSLGELEGEGNIGTVKVKVGDYVRFDGVKP
jgi:hypothetical protein